MSIVASFRSPPKTGSSPISRLLATNAERAVSEFLGAITTSLTSWKLISPVSAATFWIAVRVRSAGHPECCAYWATNTKVA